MKIAKMDSNEISAAIDALAAVDDTGSRHYRALLVALPLRMEQEAQRRLDGRRMAGQAGRKAGKQEFRRGVRRAWREANDV